jgi:hypothetical protein
MLPLLPSIYGSEQQDQEYRDHQLRMEQQMQKLSMEIMRPTKTIEQMTYLMESYEE